MLLTCKRVFCATVLVCFVPLFLTAQSPSTASRQPSRPIRPVVVLTAQTVADVQKKLGTDNKAEDLIGGEGMQLRVAIQHEKGQPAKSGEVHDASDDVYYVIEGTATLTVGGTLETPREIEPGEWRGPRIVGGRTFDVGKGDLIIVPRGTPHQRSTANKDFTMILIKVFAEPRPAVPVKTKDK